jgi:hypothetical protein
MAEVVTNDTSSVLRLQFESVHIWLEGTLQDVTPEQAHWQPSGRVVPPAVARSRR